MFVSPPQLAAMKKVVERRPLVKRGAVTMTFDPLEFRWNDTRVALSPVEGAMLAALLRRSRLRWEAANAVLADNGCCIDSRDVLIHRIRRKFAEIGAADPIETVRGWGIRFRTEADAQGSSAFWIGATEGESIVAG
jgi:DNA-binding response OmpR family regulator